MWERADLKRRAKEVLKGSYWKAFLVSLVMGVASSSSSWNRGSNSNNGFNSSGTGGLQTDQQLEHMLPFIIGVTVVVGVVILLSLVLHIIVGYHLQVGGRRYFIQAAQGDVNMGYLGHGFKKGRYGNIIKTMFWRDFINFLWYLLLIIPGIVKSYAYSMVPYILADNPEIGYKRALELSEDMTQGEKFNIWVLQLSFIGWYLLGMLLCGIGIIFVSPYDNSTQGELYLVLRQQAIEKGLCDYKELNLVRELKVTE